MGCEVRVPGVGQAGEAGAEGVVVGADQRVGALHVDVVGDRHQAAGADLGAERAGGAGQEQGLAASQFQGSDGEFDGSGSRALVKMDAALHAGDALAAESAEHQLTGVAVNARAGETGQVGVGDRDWIFDPLRQTTEAGAQHDADAGGESRGSFGDDFRGVFRGGGGAHAGRFLRSSGFRGRTRTAAIRQASPFCAHLRDRRRGSERRGAELAEALAAAAAGGAEQAVTRFSAHDDDFDDAAVSARDHHADGAGLGALALGVGRVFHIGGGVELAAVGAEAGADGKLE